jgi:PA14 domain
VYLDCPQGRRLDATYSDDVSFNRAKKALRTYQIEGFDRGNAYPARTLACPFSASWTGQGEAPTSGVCAFTTAADDGVWPFVGGRQPIEIDVSGATDGFLRSRPRLASA